MRELIRAYERSRARDIATAACPDASTLAAYFERTLAAAEAAGWEAHFAQCAYCREQLAALVHAGAGDAESSTDVAMMSWWRAHRWLPGAALATAAMAAVVAVALIVKEHERREAPEVIALAERAVTHNGPAARAASATAPSPQSEDVLERRDVEGENVGALKSEPGTESAAKRTKTAVSEFAKTDLSKEKGRASAENAQRFASNASAPAARLQRAAPAAETAPEALAYGGGRQGAAQAPVGGAVMGAAPRAAPGSSAVENELATAGLPGAAAIAVEPPDHSVVWMIGAHGAISRYTAGGTWSPQESDTTADLTAGSAVSRSVCWVVGRDGTIRRTLDGVHWQKVTPPTSADLVGVSSTSGSEATITASDHRTYTTSDGGVSWRPQ